MVRKLVVALLIAALALAVAAPAALAAKPDDSPWKTTPQDLPVLKLPGELLAGGLASPTGGNPHGPDWTPPGQDKKPKPPPRPEVNKWAVVIGIADYSGVENDLWHPDEDAIEMKQALIDNYGFPEDNVKLLLDRKANARAILRAIDWLAKNEDAESTVVFFFSGHGFQKADSANWDSDIEGDGVDEGIVSYDMFGITDGQLRDKFSAFETQKFALIFGQCFSGGMFDDDHDLQAPGRVISVACEKDQVTWDYYYLNNTLFGYYYVDQALLGHPPIEGYAYAPSPSPPVSIEDALLYAEPLVKKESLKIPASEWPEGVPTVTDPALWDSDPGEELIP